MKELTIEEKAKAYDELFAKAKTMMVENTNEVDGAKILTNLFPQFAESEDERIRKDIVFYIAAHHKDDEEKARWLAWLEKQDYTFEIKEGHWYKCVCDYMLDSSNLMFKNGRLYYCRSDWRLSGEIDERNVKDIGVNGYKSFFRPATNQEIKDWLEKQDKPAWNKEDEKMLDDIIEASTHHCYLNITDIEWLKSLKERIQPQPKQEWSEEDEYLLDETIKHLESLIRIIEKQGSAYSDEIQYYQRDIDWLKSLRPQKWRPTEDQIMCLQDAISNYQHRGYKAETLESLCKQLKQL